MSKRLAILGAVCAIGLTWQAHRISQRFRRLVRICATTEEFVANLDQLIARKATGPRMEMSREMDTESWDEKVEEMSRIVKDESQHIALQRGA